MMIGLFFALFAGSLVGLQNIFNSKVNEHTGSWTTTTLVLGLGFFASLILGLFSEGLNMFNFENMQLWYWLSGIIGVGVVFSVVQGIKILGATYAISIALTSQLVIALLFDSFGLLGLEKVPFSLNQLIGVLVIIGGILIFKFGGTSEDNVTSKSA
ncbi:DMT family transporter [Bacillus solimangrovi]|uniref:EamA-like transporter family protein n=1 Tax=Bacillus solimangrovi TaxID=1305675 RepID=A0A1E5LHT2_9BACI|nr:DMT family transporter [Bacillus solimangrovi]OEH93621.1 hypothetical protein BFG57_01145 [Bacillus solimangrovi]